MKREITYTELFRLANAEAKVKLWRDRKPTKYKFNPVTRKPKPVEYGPCLMTWAQALSLAFQEMYRKYSVVRVISVEQQLKDAAQELEYNEVMRFYDSGFYAGTNRAD